MMEKIQVLTGDITHLAVDAIVNAANSSLLGGGGVDGAIHRAAGPELLAYCRTLSGCPVGEARISPGFALPARHIIHAVGPVWHGGDKGEAQLLAGCYRQAFGLAAEYGLKSLAFPAISCGVYRYPHRAAADIAVAECRQALAHQPELEQVYLVAFDPAMAATLQAALDGLP